MTAGMTKEELRAVREALGFTQTEMAKRMRTGLRQYQKWENGEAGIRPIVALTVELLQSVAGTEVGKDFNM